MLEEGSLAPDFCLPDANNNEVCLKDYKGKWIILYFYPKAMTPGCTTEACDFSASYDAFEAKETVILGVSADPPTRQMKFINKHDLRITLLSDEEHKMLEAYDVWKPKKLYGKEFLGIVRSTYIIDPEGKIAKTWLKVKVAGHVEEVKSALENLQNE